ncbi:MAG: dipeptide epimerase [Proteobacteria bacterium]|nr:dipeptide epimerase [Pseudomonadota bacterium]
MTITLRDVRIETFPIAGSFNISRGSKREAKVVVAHVSDGVHEGRGECVPYAHYGETVDGVATAIGELRGTSLDRQSLQRKLHAGAARNALDCALIDLDAKARRTSAASVLGVAPPAAPQLTCYTLSLDKPGAMAEAARRAGTMPLLKLKLGGGRSDLDRLEAVRAARPDARLVADANEASTPAELPALLAAARAVGLEVLEQPLPADADGALVDIAHDVPICADESVHTSADLARLAGLYDAVNIKLDKAGGLTEAVAMARDAQRAGFKIMVGCMVATSLSMAPAWLLAGFADWLDLDGPLLLAADRTPAVSYANGLMHPPPASLWG